jgi:cyclic pyranopterin phosphate synthase
MKIAKRLSPWETFLINIKRFTMEIPNSFFDGITPRDMMKLATVEMLLGLSSVKSEPVICTFSISHKCNYKCLKCGFHGPGKQYIWNEYDTLDVSNYYNSFKYFMSAILGGDGEPLLSPVLDSIIGALRKNCHQTIKSLITNGSLLYKINNEFIASLNVISISLDTMDHNKYKYLTKCGSLDTVLMGIKRVSQINPNIAKKCTVVVGSYNLQDVEQIYNFCKHNSFVEMNITPLITHDKRLLPNVCKKEMLQNFLNSKRDAVNPKVVAKSGIDLFFQSEFSNEETITTATQLNEYYKQAELAQHSSGQNTTQTSSDFAAFDLRPPENVPSFEFSSWRPYYNFLCDRVRKFNKIILPYCLAPWYFVIMSLDEGILAPCCVLSNRIVGKNRINLKRNSFLASDALNLHAYHNSEYMISLRSSLLRQDNICSICNTCKSNQRYGNLHYVFSVCEELGIPKSYLEIKNTCIVS